MTARGMLPVPALMAASRGLVATGWLGLSAVLVARSAAPAFTKIARLSQGNPPRLESLALFLATIAVAIGVSVLAGAIAPAYWRRVMIAVAVIAGLVTLVASSNLAAGIAALVVLAPPLVCGRVVTGAVAPGLGTTSGWAVGGALGLGLLSASALALARGGQLAPAPLAAVLVIATAALVVWGRPRLQADISLGRAWLRQPVAFRPLDQALAGLLLALGWLGWINALAPDITGDAVTAHLPVAQPLARTGQVSASPDIPLAAQPGAGHLLYAAALVMGPPQAAKLVNVAAFALTVLAVWSLARLLGDARGALIAAVGFAAMPLALWFTQTAYLDLLTTLYAVVAGVIVLSWRDDASHRGTALLLGAALGLGLAVKLTFSYVAAGLVVALLLVAWRARVRTMLATGLLAGAAMLAVALPWLVATALPLLQFGVTAVTRPAGVETASLTDLGQYGLGRSLSAFVQTPFTLLLQSERYGRNAPGFAGYLVFCLAPLALLARPSRRYVPLLVAAAVAFTGWFLSAQILRYALPFLAILAALGAAALSSVLEPHAGKPTRALATALALVLALAGLSGYLARVLAEPGVVPFRVAFGRESARAYLRAHLGGFDAIALLDREVGATRAYAPNDQARAYSRVAIGTPFSDPAISAARSDADLLRLLDAGGFSHILIDRQRMPPNWSDQLVLNETFLRRYTMLVGGGHNAYLYRLSPPGLRAAPPEWTAGPDVVGEATPGAPASRPDRAWPGGWSVVGNPRYDGAARVTSSVWGAARVARGEAAFLRVPIAGGARYLLSHRTQAIGEPGLARLQLNWLRADDTLAGVSIEVVPTSPAGYHQFSMLASAPLDAVAALVYLQPQAGDAWFDDLSLRLAATPNPAR